MPAGGVLYVPKESTLGMCTDCARGGHFARDLAGKRAFLPSDGPFGHMLRIWNV